jgi:hypothetical protein
MDLEKFTIDLEGFALIFGRASFYLRDFCEIATEDIKSIFLATENTEVTEGLA